MTLRRMKTYTGGRDTSISITSWASARLWPDAPEAPASEYIFDVTSDRKTTFAVSVFLPDEALQAGQRSWTRVD